MITLPDFLRFYKEVFLLAYSELVGYLGDKPRQVLIEIENMSTHLVRSIDIDESESRRQENLQKAYNHLVRVTIDCYKILWIQVKEDILELKEIADAVLADITKEEFYVKKQIFKDMCREARALEMTSVGNSPERCLEAYSAVVYYGWDIIKKYKTDIIMRGAVTGEDPPIGYEAPFGKAASIDTEIEKL